MRNHSLNKPNGDNRRNNRNNTHSNNISGTETVLEARNQSNNRNNKNSVPPMTWPRHNLNNDSCDNSEVTVCAAE